MAEVDFMSALHKSTKRDYLARVNDREYPKARAAALAKKFDFEYWDGDRRICYGGYKYIPGRWEKVAKEMINYYKLPDEPKVLDIGCGKGYFLYDFLKIKPKAKVYGIDISEYAVNNSKSEIKDNLQVGNANKLPWADNTFDLVVSINNALPAQLRPRKAMKEMERLKKKYLCVEAIEQRKKKPIFFTGKSAVKRLIHLENGNAV